MTPKPLAATKNKIRPPSAKNNPMWDRIDQASARIQRAQDEREAASRLRFQNRGLIKTDPEQAKADKKALAAKTSAMTKVLIPLASIGFKEGLQKAVQDGADLSKAHEKSSTPLLAAIMGGHFDCARWLLDQPRIAWADERAYRGWGFTELSAATHVDNVEMCEALLAKRPKLLGTSRSDNHSESGLIELALHQSPRVAAWLIANHRGEAKKARSKRSGYQGQWYNESGALFKALQSGWFEQASALFDFLRPLFEKKGILSYANNPSAHRFIETIFRADDSAALAWVMKKSPVLTDSMLSGVGGTAGANISSHHYNHQASFEKTAARLERMDKSERGSACHMPALDSVLALWAANMGAQDCLDLILSLDEFKAQVAQAQSAPERFAWETPLFCVNDPGIVKSLEAAGYDFYQSTPDHLNYVALILEQHKATVKWLEMIGRDKSALLSPRAKDGKTPFDVAAMSNPSAKLSKMRAVCEKAAIRVQASRSKAGKELKARAGPRRL